MSENESVSEQQQQMEKIFICSDIWHGVFAFLDPFEVGLKMALISDRLDVLVDVHFKSRKWSLGWLIIRRANDGNGAEIVKLSGDRLPIPQEPIPKKVIGFKHILRRPNRHRISSTHSPSFRLFQDHCLYYYPREPKPQLGNYLAKYLAFGQWQHLRTSFGLRARPYATILSGNLRNCANLRSIDSYDLFPAFPAEDNTDASSEQALAKWLLTPRGDCLPKMLSCGFYSARMDGLKWSFVNASEPANFIIRLRSSSGFEPFELKNNLTREQLSLRLIGGYGLLVRCPIGREEDKWANWEKEAIEWEWCRQWNSIGIRFEDSDIGDGMVDAKTKRIATNHSAREEVKSMNE